MGERVARMLAKMTAATPSFEPGKGGVPELTAQDVAAALGYAEGRVPADRLGVHLVQAKFCADEASYRSLLEDNRLPFEAYKIWWELKLTANNNRDTVVKLAKVALDDFCEPGKAQGRGDIYIRQRIGIGHETWMKAYRFHYSAVVHRMMWLAEPVLAHVSRFLRREAE